MDAENAIGKAFWVKYSLSDRKFTEAIMNNFLLLLFVICWHISLNASDHFLEADVHDGVCFSDNGKIQYVEGPTFADFVMSFSPIIHPSILRILPDEVFYNDVIEKTFDGKMFFPTQKKSPAFIEHVDSGNWLLYPYVQLSALGKEIIEAGSDRKYVSFISFLIAFEILPTQGNKLEHTHFARKLQNVIGEKFPKWRGLSYRKLLLSPLELFVFAEMNKFFLPPFMTTTINPSEETLKAYPDSDADEHEKYFNVIFEFDSNDFYRGSTIMESTKEVCFKSHSAFQWEGMYLTDDEIPVVKLKTINLDGEKTIVSKRLSTEWMNKRRHEMYSRFHTPKSLSKNFQLLASSYKRNVQPDSDYKYLDERKPLPGEPIGVEIALPSMP